MHSNLFSSFILILIATYFIPYALAGLNLLSSISSGNIFSFGRNPHIQYLSGGQVAHSLSFITPTFLLQPSDAFLHHSESESSTLSPSTSVWINDWRTIFPDTLKRIFKSYEEKDDVWSETFLENLFIYFEHDLSNHRNDAIKIPAETYAYVKSLGVSRLFISDSVYPPPLTIFPKHGDLIPTYRIISSNSKPPIPPGPFVINLSSVSRKTWYSRQWDMEIHNVYRLYLDEYDAFLFGAIPDLVNEGYIPTNITSSQLSSSSSLDEDTETQLIPIPSRIPCIFFPSSRDLPLTGLRFGLKDIFDARGLPTAAGSLAYALTHPTPNNTSPSLTPLLNSGVAIVGKTRTSQFAHGAHPWEYVDFAYSYNPRGDGYMTAAASSSGSAVAIAGYEWLDGSVGSDTRGSVRRPAALVGVYGIRPSWGKWLDMTAVVPLSDEMDTAGFFVRDPNLFVDVATRWYDFNSVLVHQDHNASTMVNFPNVQLIYPTEHFPIANPSAQRLIDHFVASLTSHLKIYPIYTNFTNILAPFFPSGRFSDFQGTANTLAEYRSWMDVGEPTTRMFVELFGKEPIFDPVPQRLFKRTRDGQVTKEIYGRAVKRRRSFQDSMENIFLGSFDGRTSEEQRNGKNCDRSTLFAYHTGTGARPSYRVEDLNYLQGSVPFSMNLAEVGAEPPRASEFFHLVASMGGLPEVTIPLGEVDYWSQISRRWEPIPVSVQIVGARGCDALLVDLVRVLAAEGVLGTVGVGRSMHH